MRCLHYFSALPTFMPKLWRRVFLAPVPSPAKRDSSLAAGLRHPWRPSAQTLRVSKYKSSVDNQLFLERPIVFLFYLYHLPQVTTMAEPPIRYDIHRPACCYRYDITGPDASQNLFFCKVNKFTRAKPDLVLHAGVDATAPIAAVSHVVAFSQHFKLGLGTTEEADKILWEDLKRADSNGSQHHWSVEIPNDNGEKRSMRRVGLIWKRTTSVTVEGAKAPRTRRRGHRGHRGWKLIEESSPKDVLAVFTFDRLYGRRGLVQINASYGQAFNTWVLISLLTMYERQEGN